MQNIIWGVLLATVVLGATPIPTNVLTITVNPNWAIGSLVRSEEVPPGSKLFMDEEEVLASIHSDNYNSKLCSLAMTSFSLVSNKHYETGWVCPG